MSNEENKNYNSNFDNEDILISSSKKLSIIYLN